ncbi:Uridylate kinase [Rickettsiales endosymbiont of Paramecium tredecaurelia]|uniref:UMP kinase n=1 Tax=Candidatus Sarmatiella mevalonica TaxID=2770581 RepID=UPI00192321A7|nr:UMP kinase [Candidatus Sarmatiella mevalonica]MBL3284823.1 Uridylate kinase [Candidatus Sarmatiella mevalonica]
MTQNPKYKKKVLLKLSGEALMGEGQFAHDYTVMKQIAQDVIQTINRGVQISIVVGGGNICRGSKVSTLGLDRVAADHMGMLSTVINAIALQNIIEKMGVNTRVMSAIPIDTICEPYIMRRAVRHLEKGRVVIFAAGTGNPFFTTDTVAVLRAVEMGCDVLLKGTQTDGVYDKDPAFNDDCVRYENISYKQILKDELKVMDMTAVALAAEHTLPIYVFSIQRPGAIQEVVEEKGVYTRIT